MEFYWNFRDIPELKALGKAQQTEVWAATMGRRVRDPYMLRLLVPYFLIVCLCYYLGGRFLLGSWGSSIGGGIGAGLGVFVYLIISYRRARPFLVEEIRRRSW